VNRLWQLHNLKPHLTLTFKLSRDRKFIEKLTDVVGLYLNPPQKAIVLCVDEKSQIQALDRTQPGLPMKKGLCFAKTPCVINRLILPSDGSRVIAHVELVFAGVSIPRSRLQWS